MADNTPTNTPEEQSEKQSEEEVDVSELSFDEFIEYMGRKDEERERDSVQVREAYVAAPSF
jgi:hypothetical protein